MCILTLFLGGRGRWRRVQGYWYCYWCVGSYSRNMKVMKPSWEQNGLHPMVNICRLLWLNTREWGENLTSQLSWAAAWLLVTCVSPVYLVVDEFSPCVLWPLMIGLMLVSLTFFFNTMSMFLLKGSWCRECVWNLRTKLCYIASRKWNVSRVSLLECFKFNQLKYISVV